MNEFNDAVKLLSEDSDSKDCVALAKSVLAVAAVANVARMWFQGSRLDYTAEDLMRFVELVQMERNDQRVFRSDNS